MENEKKVIKKGRPKIKDGYGERLDIRIGPSERAALNHMLIESDRNQSEIVRKALMVYYHLYPGKW